MINKHNQPFWKPTHAFCELFFACVRVRARVCVCVCVYILYIVSRVGRGYI